MTFALNALSTGASGKAYYSASPMLLAVCAALQQKGIVLMYFHQAGYPGGPEARAEAEEDSANRCVIERLEVCLGAKAEAVARADTTRSAGPLCSTCL